MQELAIAEEVIKSKDCQSLCCMCLCAADPYETLEMDFVK